ncbi:MAG: hypothetical protein ACLFUB_02865 [Cyclobacteriaceae bacterium]
MKTKTRKPVICLLLGLFFYTSTFLSAQAQQPQIEEMSQEEIGQEQLNEVRDMANKILTQMAEGSYFTFNEENAIPMVVQQLDENAQKQAYSQIQAQLGDYQSDLEFKEAYKMSQGPQKMKIYRFQSDFSKATSEVRLVYTEDEKLAGLLVLPWNDKFR